MINYTILYLFLFLYDLYQGITVILLFSVIILIFYWSRKKILTYSKVTVNSKSFGTVSVNSTFFWDKIVLYYICRLLLLFQIFNFHLIYIPKYSEYSKCFSLQQKQISLFFLNFATLGLSKIYWNKKSQTWWNFKKL